jgi:hypothetical protein
MRPAQALTPAGKGHLGGGCRVLGGIAPRLGIGPRAASILRTPPGLEGSKGQQALTGVRGPLISFLTVLPFTGQPRSQRLARS